MKPLRKALLRTALLGVIGVFLPAVPMQEAVALTPTTGSIVAYGELFAPGLTTSPLGATPDPAQWYTWPTHSWQLYSNGWGPHFCMSYRPDSTKDLVGRAPAICSLYAAGVVYGWCDLSRGVGTPGYYGYDGSYSSGAYSDFGGFKAFRWTGTGATLTVSADMEAWGNSGEFGGTMVGTITLLGTGNALLDLCADPDGIQSPIPVLINFEYVLQ